MSANEKNCETAWENIGNYTYVHKIEKHVVKSKYRVVCACDTCKLWKGPLNDVVGIVH